MVLNTTIEKFKRFYYGKSILYAYINIHFDIIADADFSDCRNHIVPVNNWKSAKGFFRKYLLLILHGTSSVINEENNVLNFKMLTDKLCVCCLISIHITHTHLPSSNNARYGQQYKRISIFMEIAMNLYEIYADHFSSQKQNY